MDILINASGSKAVKEFANVGRAASTEMGKAEKATGGLTSKLAGAGEMAKAGLAAGLAVGGAALVSFAGAAINASSELGEQQSATNVIFKDGADIVRDYAERTATSLGISERAALQAANGFGDLFLNVGFTAKQAGQLSTAFVSLAGDLASFKNVGTDEALAKLQSGLVGEYEPLKSLGIIMNEAEVKSKALELGLGGAHRELTAGEKIAARYVLVIDKTKNAQGDAARTADSFANQQRRMQAEMENSRAALGDKLTPAMTEFQKLGLETLNSVDQLAGAGNGGGLARLVEGLGDAPGAFQILNGVMGLFGDEAKLTQSTVEQLTLAEENLGLAAGTLAEATKDEAAAQKLAAAATAEHAKQVDRQNNAMLNILGAELGYERALDSLEDAQQDVADAQKALTDAVAAHGPKSIEATQAAEALSRAQTGLRGDILSGAEAFAKQAQEQAIANGRQWNAVDAARAQINGLKDMKHQYPELRAEIDAYIKRLEAIPGVVNTNVTLTGRDIAPDSSGRRNRLTADGGIFSGAQVRVIGEAGPEAVIPLSASKRQRAAMLLQQSGLVSGWADGGLAGFARASTSALVGAPMNITIVLPPGSDGEDVVAAIKRYERNNGASWRN